MPKGLLELLHALGRVVVNKKVILTNHSESTSLDRVSRAALSKRNYWPATSYPDLIESDLLFVKNRLASVCRQRTHAD